MRRITRDGAVVLCQVFGTAWIELLRAGVALNMAEPGRFAHRYASPGKPGLFFGDYCNWLRIEEYRRFVTDSPAAGIAARIMGSRKVNFFHEHVLVKEAETGEPTPWHHDQPYWTVDGTQVCSLWIPLDPVARETCVEFPLFEGPRGPTDPFFNAIRPEDLAEAERLART